VGAWHFAAAFSAIILDFSSAFACAINLSTFRSIPYETMLCGRYTLEGGVLSAKSNTFHSTLWAIN
jgi:hypothetical protein